MNPSTKSKGKRVRNKREEQIEFVFLYYPDVFHLESTIEFFSFSMAVLYCNVGSICCYLGQILPERQTVRLVSSLCPGGM